MKKQSNTHTITKTNYLKQHPQDITKNCDTARGIEVIDTLWDYLISNGYMLKVFDNEHYAFIKTCEKTINHKKVIVTESYIFPSTLIKSISMI
jgi:hypothetical protein